MSPKPAPRRCDELEALARIVAHDLNNVFAAILGCADLLALRLKDNAQTLDDTKEIQQAAERGAALTKQLHAFLMKAPDQPSRSRKKAARA